MSYSDILHIIEMNDLFADNIFIMDDELDRIMHKINEQQVIKYTINCFFDELEENNIVCMNRNDTNYMNFDGHVQYLEHISTRGNKYSLIWRSFGNKDVVLQRIKNIGKKYNVHLHGYYDCGFLTIHIE